MVAGAVERPQKCRNERGARGPLCWIWPGSRAPALASRLRTSLDDRWKLRRAQIAFWLLMQQAWLPGIACCAPPRGQFTSRPPPERFPLRPLISSPCCCTHRQQLVTVYGLAKLLSLERDLILGWVFKSKHFSLKEVIPLKMHPIMIQKIIHTLFCWNYRCTYKNEKSSDNKVGQFI